jgi:hypothetical protein
VADRLKASSVPWCRHAERDERAPRARRRLAALQLPAQAQLLAGLDAVAGSVRGERRARLDHQDRLEHRRRLLVKAAWHYARNPAIGATLANRQAGQPEHILRISWRAQHRLRRTHERFKTRGKPANVATIAVARELAGFLWAAATAP